MLEAAQYDDNAFATVTYSDDKLPADNSVSPKILSDFVKRLRKEHSKHTTRKIRYFGCGEYGELSGRPHYHLALFNYPSCEHGRTRVRRSGCCFWCDNLARAWGLGRSDLGELNQQSAAYIAGYVVKKWTNEGNPGLEGRLPEFARMSLRPGIGLGMAHEIASTLMHHKSDEHMIDVPISLRHGSMQWPLGRYLRRKLRTYIGRDENAPQAVTEEMEKELQLVRQAAWDSQTSVKAAILEKSLGRRIQIQARQRRYGKKGTL